MCVFVCMCNVSHVFSVKFLGENMNSSNIRLACLRHNAQIHRLRQCISLKLQIKTNLMDSKHGEFITRPRYMDVLLNLHRRQCCNSSKK